MSKTTFQAIFTVLLILVAGVLLMFSDPNRRATVADLYNQAETYVTGAKDAATSAVDNAGKSFGEVKDALGNTH